MGGSRRPAAGAVVTLGNAGRAGCVAYAVAAAPHCASDRVLLSGSPQAITARWVLHPGPQPGTFFLASAACPWCKRRWLGVACGDSALRLHARDNAHAKNAEHNGAQRGAALLWRLALPACEGAHSVHSVRERRSALSRPGSPARPEHLPLFL